MIEKTDMIDNGWYLRSKDEFNHAQLPCAFVMAEVQSFYAIKDDLINESEGCSTNSTDSTNKHRNELFVKDSQQPREVHSIHLLKDRDDSANVINEGDHGIHGSFGHSNANPRLYDKMRKIDRHQIRWT